MYELYTEAPDDMRLPVTYCVDVGSVKKRRFAWARANPPHLSEKPTCSQDIKELVESLLLDLSQDSRVALGFECPLFVPISDDPLALTDARVGEGNRPWCAGAGAGVLATGLTQVVWILKEVKRRLERDIPAYVNWELFEKSARGLYVWEAFISGESHGSSHEEDARMGVQLFLKSHRAETATRYPTPVHSLVGAALLRTGWTKDVAIDSIGGRS